MSLNCMPMPHPKSEVTELIHLFYDEPGQCGQLRAVDSSQVPWEYRRLLAHNEHMTVAMEAHHESLVNVEILESRQEKKSYARKILLRRQRDEAVVQFGILRICFDLLEDAVREEIQIGQRPLGRILVRHNVMRTVRLENLWHVEPGADLASLFGTSTKTITYGRTATIELGGEKAVEVLEIVSPEEKIYTGP